MSTIKLVMLVNERRFLLLKYATEINIPFRYKMLVHDFRLWLLKNKYNFVILRKTLVVKINCLHYLYKKEFRISIKNVLVGIGDNKVYEAWSESIRPVFVISSKERTATLYHLNQKSAALYYLYLSVLAVAKIIIQAVLTKTIGREYYIIL